MMHEPTGHPADERLSALADDDAGATDDRVLRDHVAGCARCAALVEDLLGMRSALAQLPDVTPPRPLRLLPLAVEPRPARFAAFARRLFAPALAAGVLLTVVGGAGAYVTQALPALTGATGGAAVSAERQTVGTDAAAPAAAPSADRLGNLSNGNAEDRTSGAAGEPSAAGPVGVPWLVVLAVGLLLLAASAFMRFVLQPRAG